jgi:carboxypeptidase Q
MRVSGTPLILGRVTRVILLIGCLLPALDLAVAQDKSRTEAAKVIRNEALNNSQIMEMIGYLTDVSGPRLTGSPNLKRSEEYVVGKLNQWGVTNAHLEAWGPFGPGWTLEAFTASIVPPGFSPLIGYPKAWSPGTDGTLRGDVVWLNAETVADLDRFKGTLRHRIVLFSPAQAVNPLFDPSTQRQTDQELSLLSNAPPADPNEAPFTLTPAQRVAAQLSYRKWQLIEEEGAAVVLQPSFRDAGTLYATAATVPNPIDIPSERRRQPWDLNKPRVTPQVIVAAEQYNRMIRLLQRGIAVQVEIGIKTRFYDDDPMSYNVIAEIPGTDLKDEIVMIGGCIDSWHAGTGATDNAAGAATALEVIRILQSAGLKPRRTIRIGLWSAEEQGTLGSRAYVAKHLAKHIDSADPQAQQRQLDLRPEYEKFDVYFNFDFGTGRIRGLYLQGNGQAKTVIGDSLAVLDDPSVKTLSLAGIGASDHMSFDEVGLPAFQWIRDYMDGNARAAHTNMVTYDHVQENDLKESAGTAAFLVYDLAMRSEKVPRRSVAAH